MAAGAATPPEPGLYEARPDASVRATLADVLAARTAGIGLLDSRPRAFYLGAEKHRSVRAAGHIPGARNLSHTAAFDTGGRLRRGASLLEAFAAIAEEGALIAYCNTGHWAATNWFILSELLGRKNVRLYDGSMLDYAADPSRPVSLPAAPTATAAKGS